MDGWGHTKTFFLSSIATCNFAIVRKFKMHFIRINVLCGDVSGKLYYLFSSPLFLYIMFQHFSNADKPA